MKFDLERFNRNILDEELVADLVGCASRLRSVSLTMSQYQQYGKYDASTLIRRFGSWHAALDGAGLEAGKARNHVSNPALFDNLAVMWESLGRQPRAKEVTKPFSRYACNTYLRRFGTWQRALQAFVDYVDSPASVSADDVDGPGYLSATAPEAPKHRTCRNVSERQRFRVLLRDGFACTSCGSSPLKSRDVELHVDHVLPWSQGGETVDQNLITKCSRCNLGKGSMMEACDEQVERSGPA